MKNKVEKRVKSVGLKSSVKSFALLLFPILSLSLSSIPDLSKRSENGENLNRIFTDGRIESIEEKRERERVSRGREDEKKSLNTRDLSLNFEGNGKIFFSDKIPIRLFQLIIPGKLLSISFKDYFLMSFFSQFLLSLLFPFPCFFFHLLLPLPT